MSHLAHAAHLDRGNPWLIDTTDRDEAIDARTDDLMRTPAECLAELAEMHGPDGDRAQPLSDTDADGWFTADDASVAMLIAQMFCGSPLDSVAALGELRQRLWEGLREKAEAHLEDEARYDDWRE